MNFVIISAEKYYASLAQIILRWHIERGLVPVVKTSSEKRVKENTDIFLLHFLLKASRYNSRTRWYLPD